MRVSAEAPILLTGATGYIGRALLERLLAKGRRVRCVVRDATKLTVDEAAVEVVEADLADKGALARSFEPGCVAYFLVHALGAGSSLGREERALAENFAAAARDAGAARIVYLGGLVDADEPDLSDHMSSRVLVGRLLAESGVPTIELRASIVIGSGSLSFELIRKVVDWVPVIALPGWADNLAQPIAVDDVVSYLVAAATADLEAGVYEIGGADQISYRDLIEEYARQVGAQRLTVSLPIPQAAVEAATAISQPALELLPAEAQEALKLLESMRHSTVVRNPPPSDVFEVQPMSVSDAIGRAVGS